MPIARLLENDKMVMVCHILPGGSAQARSKLEKIICMGKSNAMVLNFITPEEEKSAFTTLQNLYGEHMTKNVIEEMKIDEFRLSYRLVVMEKAKKVL